MISCRQSLEQPSPLTRLPSSHSSVAASFPSPQADAHVLDVGAKPVSVSLKLEPVLWRSAWKSATS